MFRSNAVVVLAALAACAAPVDRQAEEEALRQADIEFSRQTTERGADGWAEFFATDGVMFPNSGRIDGRDAIREAMDGFLTAGVPTLVWEPTRAVVSESGDLGYTIGRWQALTTGGEVASEGNYVSIWKKEDGAWRVAVDLGNEDAPPPAAEE